MGVARVRPVAAAVAALVVCCMTGSQAPPAAAATARQGRVANRFALRQVGKPYRWGGEGPRAYDCSGLTWRAWRRAGEHIQRTSRRQFRSRGRVVRRNLRKGDLLFFYHPVSHVGMYVGKGRMVHASSSNDRVTVVDFKPGGWYWRHFTGARRPR